MEAVETMPSEQAQGVINLPMGLLGFEQHKRYVLLGSPEEAPFLWLHMADDANLSFLVISPFMVLPSYQPELSEEDTKFLGLQNPEDALIFNIATVHPDGQATVNLKGPIVVNRQTLTGKQCIPRNSANYSLQHAIE
jgi:flagellar assembly factor FliW